MKNKPVVTREDMRKNVGTMNFTLIEKKHGVKIDWRIHLGARILRLAVKLAQLGSWVMGVPCEVNEVQE